MVPPAPPCPGLLQAMEGNKIPSLVPPVTKKLPSPPVFAPPPMAPGMYRSESMKGVLGGPPPPPPPRSTVP